MTRADVASDITGASINGATNRADCRRHVELLDSGLPELLEHPRQVPFALQARPAVDAIRRMGLELKLFLERQSVTRTFIKKVASLATIHDAPPSRCRPIVRDNQRRAFMTWVRTVPGRRPVASPISS